MSRPSRASKIQANYILQHKEKDDKDEELKCPPPLAERLSTMGRGLLRGKILPSHSSLTRPGLLSLAVTPPLSKVNHRLLKQQDIRLDDSGDDTDSTFTCTSSSDDDQDLSSASSSDSEASSDSESSNSGSHRVSATDYRGAEGTIWNSFPTNTAVSGSSIACYTPGPNITADEQLFPTKAGCRWTQYMPAKLGKFGIKFWLAADVETKYLLNGFPKKTAAVTRQPTSVTDASS